MTDGAPVATPGGECGLHFYRAFKSISDNILEGAQMTDLKRTTQSEGNTQLGRVQPDGGGNEENTGREFGASEAATRGTNRDADESGTSKNQGHGHPREERTG